MVTLETRPIAEVVLELGREFAATIAVLPGCVVRTRVEREAGISTGLRSLYLGACERKIDRYTTCVHDRPHMAAHLACASRAVSYVSRQQAHGAFSGMPETIRHACKKATRR